MNEQNQNTATEKAVRLESLVIQQVALKKEMAELQNILSEKSKVLYGIETEIAELKCPFKVGDKITNGKKQFFLSKIKSYDYGCGYKLYGYQVKKDGKPGLLEREIYSWTNKYELVV